MDFPLAIPKEPRYYQTVVTIIYGSAVRNGGGEEPTDGLVLFFALGIVAFGIGLFFWVRRPKHNNQVPSEISIAQRMFLLMLLRRSPADLSAQTLEAVARSGWEQIFGRNPDGSDYVETGQHGFAFVLQAHGNAFMVIQTSKGVRDLKPPVRTHPESAIGILSAYSHELSVGLAYNYDTDASRLCAFVGSLAAALADTEALGLLHPESGQLWRLDRETVERLKTEPEAFFGS